MKNQEIVEWARPLAKQRKPARFEELTEILGLKVPKNLDMLMWLDIFTELHVSGFGIAPNTAFNLRAMKKDDPVFLYETEVNHSGVSGLNPFFQVSLYNLGIGAYVYNAASVNTDYVKERLQSIVLIYETAEDLSDSDKAGIQANADFLVHMPPDDNFIKVLKASCSSEILEILRSAMIEFAGDPMVPREKGLSVAENVYRIFELDFKQAALDLQAL